MMPPDESTSEAPAIDRRKRRRWATVALVLLLLLALLLTPPLISLDRFQHRIATSMSESLGRPVHIDPPITFHLFPMPGFTLSNLVVSEDPAFGDEPVIRANKVEATLRVSSLWRRHVEFSTIRFEVDDHGSGPSINIVRNAAGRWNLESILMQAAHVATAPTAQRKAGPEPRFPYIEATGARVNLKLGDQKMPFSLTDADFALWLPSPQRWHLRLQGKPVRTDTDASDTGTVSLEGTLERAPQLVDVPLNLTASWAGAPLGEASRLFTGNDAGWRGTLNAGARLSGLLGSAQLTADVHLTDLRRADFIPAKLLDISAHCTAHADVATVTLADSQCTMPTSGAKPILLASNSLDLQRPLLSDTRLELPAVPLDWLLDWVRLFSPSTPSHPAAQGTVDGKLVRPAGPQAEWAGSLLLTLPPQSSSEIRTDTKAGAKKLVPTPPLVFDFLAPPAEAKATAANLKSKSSPDLAASTDLAGGSNALNLQLQPVVLHPGPNAQLTLSGELGWEGYNFHLAGSATSAQIDNLAHILPPLGDDLPKPSAKLPANSLTPLDIACSRAWDNPQSCLAATVSKPAKKHRAHHLRLTHSTK